jgi:ribosomal subunit interface protein
MDIHITARKFTLHDKLKEHAIDAVKKLSKYFDGILRCNVTFSYERTSNSVKMVDISLHLFKHDIVVSEKSDDYYKSIDRAMLKLETRLSKIKSKVRDKDKKKVREVKGKE